MLKTLLFAIIYILISQQAYAQEVKTKNSFGIVTDSLNNHELKEFISSKIASSQFLMIGEQHGIKEVGEITSWIYTLAQAYGFKHLCIETDAIAAMQITNFARGENPVELAKESSDEFPFAIPFYNNYDDYALFSQVVETQGDVWGIDQTFMAQFRLNFDYLERTSSNKQFKNELTKLKELAHSAFEKAIAEKDFSAPFIFQYSDDLHNKLMSLAQEGSEKEVLKQLKKTKEIYLYNFSNKSYLSNSNRAKLMKQNFLNYYQKAAKTEEYPKVVFKLGANHVSKGLNSTQVYDIANLISELAIINGLKSTHLLVSGIKGENAIGNPFAPVPTAAFDNTQDFPEEIQDCIKDLDHKYFILDLAPLRMEAKSYSSKLQDWMFKYDLVVLINEAIPTQSF